MYILIIMAKQNLGNKYKTLGLLILLVPIVFISLFLIGETVGGDISGLGHLAQLIPLLLLAFLAFKYPYPIGILLIYLGVVSAFLYALFSGFPLITIIIVNAVLFLPLSVSGFFLLVSTKRYYS